MRRILLLAAAFALAAAPARCEPWSRVFAAESDTVVFFGADGSLLRAPFSLASRETLWRAAGAEHVVRARVSPDGRRVAWLTRVHDADTTRLWTDGSPRPRVRYFALQPRRYDRLAYQPDVPTIEDPDIRGGRFVRPTPLMRRLCSNTLEWTPDSRAVVFGYDDGIAAAPADGGPAFVVSGAFAVGLRRLEPAPIYLVDALVLRERQTFVDEGGLGGLGRGSGAAPTMEGLPDPRLFEGGGARLVRERRAEPGAYLLYPLPHRWRVFTTSGLGPARRWTASPGTVWWAEGRAIRAVRAHDPDATIEAQTAGPVVWIGYDDARRAVTWAAERELRRRAEDEGGVPESVVLRTSAPIRAVLEARSPRLRGVVAGDSLLLWDPATDAVRPLATGGLEPSAVFAGPAGEVLVAATAGRGRPLSLARADFARGRLAPLATPSVKDGRFTATPRGERLILFDPGARAPATVQVYDVASGTWSAVENPGVTGWEPLEAR